jgi:acetyl-CoA acetyltransferase family protein
MTNTYIPYGAYWSSPFSKWQGSLAHLHSMEFAAHVTKNALAARDLSPEAFDFAVLGITVPQHRSFFGLPWFTGMIGAGDVTGPTISQACASSARVVATASFEIDNGGATCAIAATTDRCSNGPHLYYPRPKAPGGTGISEEWVMDNFSYDPNTKTGMINTAENCAARFNISTAEQHDVVLRRYQQYEDATRSENGASFQSRYMTLPLEVPDARFRKTVAVLEGDEGITSSSAEGLAKLKPIMEGGTITFGGQTHPADGCAGMVITTEERARDLSSNPDIAIRIVSFGQGRSELAHMPLAPVLASRKALEAADIKIDDVAAIKSHNPFAVNDVVFSREMGVDVASFNNYGSPLIYGHPQGPTGMRAIIELIEELVIKGGGYGLFNGCAAGDSAMAVVVKVE